jgi:hypothetical protein
MDRKQYEAMQLQAEGVVGVRVEEVQYYWGSHVIEYFSVGTAVRRLDAERQIPEPQLTLPVNTGSTVVHTHQHMPRGMPTGFSTG